MSEVDEQESSSSDVESETELRRISEEKRKSVRENHQRHIDEKINFYKSQCNVYGIEESKMTKVCIDEMKNHCDLSDCMISSLQCQLTFDAFEKFPSTQLISINLKNNHLEHFCCHSMASYINSTSSLKKLNLEGCKIGDKGMGILSAAFTASTSIEYLNLANNHITDDGGEILVSFLGLNSICKEVDLSSNKLSVKTAKIMGQVLRKNVTLEVLLIHHNRLSEQSAIVEMMKGLSRNMSLKVLDISWNALGGQSFGEILPKCLKTSQLKVIKIENNHLSSIVLTKLSQGLAISTTIEEVYVGGNFILPDDEEKLIKVFGSRSPLNLISFGYFYHLSQESHELFQKIKKSKPSIHVIFQNLIHPNPPRDIEMLDILADRVRYVSLNAKNKKLRRNMSEFMIKLKDLESRCMLEVDFVDLLKNFNANLDDQLIQQYIEACLVEADGRKRLDVHFMADHYLNRQKVSQQEEN